jgi:glutaredoxin
MAVPERILVVRPVTMMKAFFKTFLGNGQWFLLLGMLFGSAALAADKIPAPADIEVFAREGCPHCAQAEEFLHRLQQEKHELRIVIRDVSSEPAALERLQQIATQNDVQSRVPAFLIGGQFIVGYSEEASTDKLIRDALVRKSEQDRQATSGVAGCAVEEKLSCGPDTPHPVPQPETFAIDFLGHSLSLDQIGLPLFTLAMGLLDGFNPCSMWVLILMISLLAPLNDRPRMFAIAGTFIVVQGIAYFLFMAAWLNLFLLIGLSRFSEIVIAVLALLAGALNLKDSRGLGRGISLSIPTSAKPGIYARMRSVLQAENLVAALIGTVLLGMLVQIIELLCTSGFPALFTRILTLHQLDSLSYYGYLLLYDLAYMLDDVIILAIGLITLSQRRLQEKEGRWLKFVSGLVMVGLGIYLLLPY